jgi:hypothetical protein
MNFNQIVSDVRPYLPLASDVNGEVFTMPCVECRDVQNNGVATQVKYTYLIAFRKDYVDGICIGWKIDTMT